jgi:anti-sigma factor RsiW
MSTCDRAEALRDYAFDELPAADRPEMEQHIAACGDCAGELDQMRVTTAVLRVIPNREIPQRIAFVSDKVFQPSPLARFFGGFWNSAARLGFASACIIAGALIVSAYHRQPATAPAEVRTIIQTADVSKQITDAVTRAVAQVHAEDAQLFAASEIRHRDEHRALMDAVNVLQDRQNASTVMAENTPPPGVVVGQ